MDKILNELRTLSSVPPREGGAYDAWIEQADATAFLTGNLNDSDLVVYASLASTFIYSVYVPTNLVSPPNIDDMLGWNADPFSSWSLSSSFGDPASVSITDPLDNAGSEAIVNGEQFLFARSFEGDPQRRVMIEVLQKFVHVFDLHFIDERKAYCRLDRHGDIEDVIRIISIGAKGEEPEGTFVTCDRQVLDQYAALTESTVVRLFDFTRYEPDQFGGWNINQEEHRSIGEDLFYRFGIDQGRASYARGCQIVRSNVDRHVILEEFFGEGDRPERQYVSFIAHDWKNQCVKEISCDPSKLSNYFIESELPFEITPAFFRSEVLLKYKSDREKYKFKERSISCRGAWHLQTYDINDAGQVHTYLRYLGQLPYEEQLHWKQYNQEPKAPISKRAYTTDMMGETYKEYNALQSLKRKLQALHRTAVPWWRLRSMDLIDRPHYPVTSAIDEWREEILTLDQLVVEGFQERWLRKKASELGCTPEANWRSLKLVEQCLMKLDFEVEHAELIILPLRELHQLRSKVKGHASNDMARSISLDVVKKFGGYREHFEHLSKECDESIRIITEAFEDPRMR